MNVKITNKKIFWSTFSDNVPSQTYLDNFEQSMIIKNMNINQDNYFNISILSKTKDITYMITDHLGFKSYWFFQKIIKILPNGYLLGFTMDIWSTWSVKFLNQYQSKKIKVLRSHKLTKESAILTDDLLNTIPINYKKVKLKNSPSTDHIVIGQNTIKYKLNDPQFSGNWWEEGSFIEFEHLGGLPYLLTQPSSGNYYYVFQEQIPDKLEPTKTSTPASLWFLPLLAIDQTNVYYQIKDRYNNQINRIQIWNTYSMLEWLRKTPELSNKFLGVYILPNFYNFKNTEKCYDIVDYYFLNTEHFKYACLRIDIRTKKINDPIKLFTKQETDMLFLNATEQVPKLNYTDKIHPIAATAMNINFFNSIIKPALFLDEDGLNFKNWLCNFTQNAYIKLEGDLFEFNDMIINYPAKLPIGVDSYNNYVNANLYQRDNAINIANQQRIMGLTRNFFDAYSSLFSLNVSDLSPAGIAAKGVGIVGNFAFGVANNVMSYRNKIDTIKAQYKDAKNTMGLEINAGSISDAVVGYYQYSTISKYPEGPNFQYRELTPATIADLNNIIYLYGCNWTYYDTITNLTPRTDFNYLLIDREFIETTFFNWIPESTPNELYQIIKEHLSGGFRLWKVEPFFNE